jgi:hypothetical protein
MSADARQPRVADDPQRAETAVQKPSELQKHPEPSQQRRLGVRRWGEESVHYVPPSVGNSGFNEGE